MSITFYCGGSCWEKEIERMCLFDWSNLPDDLIMEILCRLPEKPLIRFKCVSKSWHSLISYVCVSKISPPFSGLLCRGIRLYGGLKYFMDFGAATSSSSIVEYKVKGCGFVESYSALLPFKHTPEDVHDCCNGLLLVVKSGAVSHPKEYYVCNPATKQCIAIPMNPSHLKTMFAVLAFDPPNYRIVRFNNSPLLASVSNPVIVDVFSSVTGEWITHVVPLDPKLYGFKCIKHPVYLNGVVYLLSYAGYLLCFDLNAGSVKARAFKLPYQNDPLGCIGVSKGCFYYLNEDGYRILIWSFQDHCCKGSEWILKHSISIHNLVQRLPKIERNHNLAPYHPIEDNYRFSEGFKPYALHPTSEIVFVGFLRSIFSYHLQTNRFELFSKFKEDKILQGSGQYCVFPYSRCLVVLNDFVQMHDIDPIC